jgi:hypothetical protein
MSGTRELGSIDIDKKARALLLLLESDNIQISDIEKIINQMKLIIINNPDNIKYECQLCKDTGMIKTDMSGLYLSCICLGGNAHE